MLTIDGSHGEGGGQVLRSALSLSLLTGQAICIEHIRARRPKPGLQAQHLAGVRAASQVGAATVEGDTFGSPTLSFAPQGMFPGQYVWDVAEERGSAGAATLVLQTVLLPLAVMFQVPGSKFHVPGYAQHGTRTTPHGSSRLTVLGGTHVPWSPPYHYVEQVYLPTLARLGLQASVQIERWGWYPQGGGLVQAQVTGSNQPMAGLNLTERGQLRRLHGLSAVSNLPVSIAERQRARAEGFLRPRGFAPHIELVEAPARGPGTVVFLVAEYEQALAGFAALGARGKPAEKVAEEACAQFIAHHQSGAAVDPHLADQLILPLALAAGPSAFTTSQITQHLLTNIWVVEQFLPVRFQVEGQEGEFGRVSVTPSNKELGGPKCTPKKV
jgi:RNA 3'-terminal phosphate cyclase (ATP)